MNFPNARKSFDFFGRLCLATTFAIAIPPKIIKFQTVVGSISKQGIPEGFASVLLISAIACLVGGVVYLLFGKDERVGPSLLLLFIVPTTLIMHTSPFQPLAVFMNLGLIGGLIITLARSKG